jgi:hypothetical protein
MPIPRRLAPSLNVPKSCVNCRSRHEKSTFLCCKECMGQACAGNKFLNHETDEIEEV